MTLPTTKPMQEPDYRQWLADNSEFISLQNKQFQANKSIWQQAVGRFNVVEFDHFRLRSGARAEAPAISWTQPPKGGTTNAARCDQNVFVVPALAGICAGWHPRKSEIKPLDFEGLNKWAGLNAFTFYPEKRGGAAMAITQMRSLLALDDSRKRLEAGNA